LARLYSRKRGKSGSVRPVSKKTPAWVKYKPEEVEALIIKLAREGNNASTIGTVLRDQYGIPLVKPMLGKKISEVLRSGGLAPKMPEDLESLLRKAEGLRKHLEKHRKDYTHKRALALVESKIHRLVKYYKASKILQPDWEYKPIAASVA